MRLSPRMTRAGRPLALTLADRLTAPRSVRGHRTGRIHEDVLEIRLGRTQRSLVRADKGATQEVTMSRSLAVLLALYITTTASLAAAQAAVPIPGTHATVVLPPGCELVLQGTISCGDSFITVGGSALTWDELRALYVRRGHHVQDLPGVADTFFLVPPSGGILLVRDGVDERLIVQGRSPTESFETGRLYGRVFMAIEPPARGPIVSGFRHLSRADIPYPTLQWVGDALFFSSTAVEVGGALSMGGSIEHTEATSMERLCEASASDAPTETLVRHHERLGREGSFCEEASVVVGPARRGLNAAFGFVLASGEGFSIRMSYALEPTDDPFQFLEGFRHFARPLLHAAVR